MTVQDTIASYWKQFLGVDHVQPGDDFIGLGGTSILAVQVANRISTDLDVQIDLPEMFSTLEEVTARCEELIREREGGAAS
jgi:hypothetical protein